MPIIAAKEFEMAFVYSTDEDVKKWIEAMKTRRASKYQSKRIPEFVAFHANERSKRKLSGKMHICSRLARKAILGNRVVLAYSKENNELMIIPSIVGNFNCCAAIAGSDAVHISALKFLLAVGFTRENLPHGRYEAQIEDDGNIHVYLNKPLYEDEQSKRLKGSVKRYDMEVEK